MSLRSSTEEKSPNPMSSEITAAEQPDGARLQESDSAAAGSSDVGLRTLAVEVGGAGIQALEGIGEWVRQHLDGGAAANPDETLGHESIAQPRGLVLRPALLGFAAMVAIAIGASMPSSPFKLEMPGVWFFGVPSTQRGEHLGRVLHPWPPSTAGCCC